MRAQEFITENYEEAGNQGTASATPPMDDQHHRAIPNMKVVSNKPSHYYDFYRLGVHMAASPNEQVMKKTGAVANNMTMVAYTQADAAIMNKSAKAMGLDLKALSDGNSSEQKEINKTSPTRNPGPIGLKK
jgi:hypothetical protein